MKRIMLVFLMFFAFASSEGADSSKTDPIVRSEFNQTFLLGEDSAIVAQKVILVLQELQQIRESMPNQDTDQRLIIALERYESVRKSNLSFAEKMDSYYEYFEKSIEYGRGEDIVALTVILGHLRLAKASINAMYSCLILGNLAMFVDSTNTDNSFAVYYLSREEAANYYKRATHWKTLVDKATQLIKNPDVFEATQEPISQLQTILNSDKLEIIRQLSEYIKERK